LRLKDFFMFNQTRNQTKESVKDAATTEPGPDESGHLPMDTGDEAADACEVTPIQAEESWEERYAHLQDQFVRLAADFDNFRKRAREEQESIARYGAQKTVLELLPVLDNLDRATASLSEKSDPQVLFKSFSLLHKQLLDGMGGLGVEKIPAVGQPFDPERHEAVNRMNSNDVPENIVLYEAQSGYALHGKVIRPAQVVVSMGPADASPASEGAENPFVQ
jgi:molecular chaperone GrpE